MTEQALSLLLTCIAAVESGNNPDAVGKHGERGPDAKNFKPKQETSK